MKITYAIGTILLLVLVIFEILSPHQDNKRGTRNPDPSNPQEITISDVSKTQEITQVSEWLDFWYSGLLAIRVTGHLTQSAVLESPLGTIELPVGNFDFIAASPEAWSKSARLRYMPTPNTQGDIKVMVCFGVPPHWLKRPPPEAQPARYTGGWTAYFPGTDQKALQGGFYHGQRAGEFIYWDQNGAVIGKETWVDGKKPDS